MAANLPVLVLATMGTLTVARHGLSPYADDRLSQISVLAIFVTMILGSATALKAVKQGRPPKATAILAAQLLLSWMASLALLWWVSLR